MLLKSHELNLRTKDFLKNKIILLYGENQDLIKDINEQIINKFSDKKVISKKFFEDDILKNPENIINYYLNGSLFEDKKNITIIKNCSDKILEIINSVKNNIQLSDSQSEVIMNSSSLKRSKVKEVMEKLNLYKNSGKITDQIIEEVCTDEDLKKNDEIIDILLSKNEKNINGFISNMSNYEKNFIEIIIILRSFIIKILDIQKNNKNLSIDEKIERYKPPIFWKDKDRIKNILKIWSTNNLEKFLSSLNIIETEFKRNDLNQDTQFYYFLTQNLSKISLKNTNNFI